MDLPTRPEMFAKPSGKLCIAIASAVKRPILNNFLLGTSFWSDVIICFICKSSAVGNGAFGLDSGWFQVQCEFHVDYRHVVLMHQLAYHCNAAKKRNNIYPVTKMFAK